MTAPFLRASIEDETPSFEALNRYWTSQFERERVAAQKAAWHAETNAGFDAAIAAGRKYSEDV